MAINDITATGYGAANYREIRSYGALRFINRDNKKILQQMVAFNEFKNGAMSAGYEWQDVPLVEEHETNT